MRRSGKGAMRESRANAAAMILESFGKMWEEGDTIHVFYPNIEFEDEENNGALVKDILAVAEYGHKVDVKSLKCKRTFLPSPSKIENGRYVGKPDFLFFAAKMAKLILKAQQLEEQIAVQQDTALSQGEIATETSRISKEYENKSPFIGKLVRPITTECVVITLKPKLKEDAQGNETTVLSPMEDKIKLCSQSMSGERIDLIGDMMNKEGAFFHEELGVFEVVYSFPKKGDKKISGRQKPDAVTKFEESALAKFPKFADKILAQIKKLPMDEELMFSRQRDFSPFDEALIVSAISSKIRSESKVFTGNITDEMVSELATMHSYLTEIRVAIKDPVLKEKYDEKVAENEKKRLEREAEEAQALEDAEAPTLDELEEEANKAASEASAQTTDTDYADLDSDMENI